jgi:DNA-binding CsgD family transcriptional regulator
MPLVGRARELRRLHDLLAVLSQHGGGLLLRGEPGIGKSALLAEATRSASERGMRVLRTTGVQSEARLPFAGLHQLLWPVIDRLDMLAPPQRHALLAAFGMTERDTPDVFLIALGTLNVLSEVATAAPVMIVVEDVHWLDRSTIDVLAFVARRLESEPILLLGAIRDGFDGGGLPELRIEGLGDDAAAALLDSVAQALEPDVRTRLLAEAAGNPLALVELPLATAQLEPGALLPAWLPLTARLEHAFAAQASELPEATRRLLLVAALNDGGSLSETLMADEHAIGVLEPALKARLVVLEGDELRFRHPLVRSAIRQAATIPERHAAHAALASVVALDRRVWHRAAAVVGPDELTATELDWTAAAAERRGALGVAVSALTRAAELSDVPAGRGARLLRAAELAFELGRSDVVVRLLRDAEALPLNASERTRMAWLRELFATQLWSGTARTTALIEIADRMRVEGDTERAVKWLRNVAFRCWWSYPDREAEARVLEAAARIPVAPDDPELLNTRAHAAPVECGREVMGVLARRPVAGSTHAAFHLADASTAVGAFSAELVAEAIAGLRAQGRVGLLAQALVNQAWVSVHLGHWVLGLQAAEEAVALAAETRQPRHEVAARLAAATLHALRADDDADTDAAADAAERVLLPMGASPLLSLAQLTRGVGALGEGRHADAYAALRRIFDPADIAHHRFIGWWAFGDLIDAAVHSDHHDEARVLVAEFELVLERSGSPLLHAGVTYARAVLGDDEALFARDGLSLYPLTRARLLLAHGAWLRRRRRLADSRVPLRAAREAFDALGAAGWGERARQELRASGETSRRRTPDAWDELTPQELQIAQLAAAGLTNREIGERLYLSHRTIGSHLYRIFPKLGVTSRSELRDAVG